MFIRSQNKRVLLQAERLEIYAPETASNECIGYYAIIQGFTELGVYSTEKDPQEDEEQMEYLKEWNNKHGNRGGD